jgi:ribose transport system permease protein/L-arabinose transport system permease protein
MTPSTDTDTNTATSQPAATARPGPLANARRLSRSVGTQNVSLLIALLILVAIFGIARPDTFFQPVNLVNIGGAVSLLAVVAFAETLVILSGGLDISVGSIVGLSSVSSAWAMVHVTNNAAAGIAAAVLAGLAAGLVNGLIITVGRVNPVVATLGTLSAFQGIAFLVAAGQSIPVLNLQYIEIGLARLAGLPVALVISLVVAVVIAVALKVTDFGRNVYALGGNPVAARFAGIPINRYKIGIYAVSGLVAGIGGIILTARTQNGTPASGSAGLELQAITAVVLGGAALTGGKGTIMGTVYGVLIIGVLQNGLNLLNVQTFYQQVATGLLLVVAVMIQQFRSDGVWRRWPGRVRAGAGVQS